MGYGDLVARNAGRHVRTLVVAAALTVSAGLPSGAAGQTLAALPSASSIGRVEPNGSARPVAGWVRFCEREPAECVVDPSEPATVTLTAKLWKTLNAVNRRVNASVRPVTDSDHWNIVDRWDLPTDGMGDCEDFQLLKRKTLADQHGLPRRAMRMTVVIDEQGEGHAVLMVRTNEGDLILDNKRSGILPWHETGYVFVKREGTDGREWVSLGELSSPATTANR